MKKLFAIIVLSLLIVLLAIFLLANFNHSNIGKFFWNTGILTSGKKLYSQRKEELIIRNYFQDLKGGFFVDIGCYHYKSKSTTYYLEKHLDWSGIAVDALADYEQGYIKYRKRTKFFTYIITDHYGTVEPFYKILGKVPGESTKIKNKAESFVKKRLEKNTNNDLRIETIEVPTMTITKLLDNNNITKIDFLSIDIEGAEMEALKGFDIIRFRPELVCITKLESASKQIVEYFSFNGYERINKYLEHDNRNWYFRLKE